MMAGIALLVLLAAALALLLTWLQQRRPDDQNKDVEQVLALLPHIQCAQCGYPGCRPYAEAIVRQQEALNLCPPGGLETARQLGRLLGRDAEASASSIAPFASTAVALIDEELCIGCARCLPACPVDAIIGASQHMHTVLASACTGCTLCLPACPVDCIRMVTAADRDDARAA